MIVNYKTFYTFYREFYEIDFVIIFQRQKIIIKLYIPS